MKTRPGHPKTVQPGIPKLPPTPRGWIRAPLGAFLQEVQRPVKLEADKEYDLITVKRARGGVERRERLKGRNILVKSQFRVNAGDFLISKRQIVHGACGLVPETLAGSIVSNEYAVFCGSDEIDLRYVKYLAETVYFQQTCFHSSVGIHVEKMLFKVARWLKWEFNIPALSEQREIIRALSSWDKAIASTQKAIANSMRQKRALMQLLLGGPDRLPPKFTGTWEEARLEDLANLNPSKPVKPDNGIVSFVSMDSVSEDARIVRYEERYYDDVQTGFTAFQEGDVLVAKITPCFENGKGAFAEGLISGVGFGSTEFHVLRAKKGVSGRLIYHIVNSTGFRMHGEANMHGSAGQKRVPSDFLKSYSVRIPTKFQDQKKIAKILDCADSTIKFLQLEHENLLKQRTFIVQQLITGRRPLKRNRPRKEMIPV